MNPYTAAATAVLVLLTLLPLSRSKRWWIRSLDFPRLQLFTAALVLIAVDALLRERGVWQGWLPAVAATGCLLFHAWWIVPYTAAFPRESRQAERGSGEDRVRILVSNVLMSNHNAAALIALVRRHEPDLLVTLESDTWWQQQLQVLEADYPFRMACPLDNRYGMHVYSRLRWDRNSVEFLVEDDVPSMHARLHLPSGATVETHFLHPRPPAPGESDQSVERDAELVMVARRVARVDGPVIVTGDLNDVAWSRTTRLFRRLSGLLDPRVGRGMYNTFHVGHWYLRWPLDHLFHSAHFSVQQIHRLPSIGSDHFPLLTELELTPAHQHEQQGLQPDD